jgi:hypothetical protein
LHPLSGLEILDREESEKRNKDSSLKILKIDSVTKRVKLFVLGF